jgi:long-chain acyl-CoA synthetase
MGQIAIPGSSSALVPPPAAPDTLPGRFFEQARRRGQATALRRKQLGLWRTISWADYAARVRELAGALLAFGLERGEAVALLGENRPSG